MTERFCKDCKWHLLTGLHYKCVRASLPANPVTGVKSSSPCTDERDYDASVDKSKCGPEGKYFEPMERPAPPKPVGVKAMATTKDAA